MKVRSSFFSRSWISYLVLAVIAASIQSYQVLELKSDPTVQGPIIDSLVYHQEARRIAMGMPAPHYPHWQSPFFPWILSQVYRVLGTDPAGGILLQGLFAVVISLQIFAIARRLLNPGTAFIAGLLACGYGPLLFFCGQLIPAPFETMLALGLLWLAIVCPARGSPVTQGMVGLALGLATAARGNIAPFGLWLLLRPWKELSWRQALARSVAILAGAFLGLLPVALSNQARSGEFSISTSNLGINLYIGNSGDVSASTGIRPGYRWDDLLAEPARNGEFSPMDQSRYFERKALGLVLRHPLTFARDMLKKASDLFIGMEIPRNLDPYGKPGRTKLTSALLWKRPFGFPFGLVLPLAVIGFMASRKKKSIVGENAEGRGIDDHALRTIFWFVLLNGLGIILFFPTGRYRLAMAMALLPVAVLGALHGAMWIRRQAKPDWAAVVLASVAGLWINLAPPFTGPDMRNEADLQLGWAYLTANQLHKAAQVLQDEVRVRPDNADAWRSLGEVKDRMGDRLGAIEVLKKAVALAPRFAHAWQHLGAIENAEKRYTDAKEALERSVEINPGHPLAWSDLALAYLEINDTKNALYAARRAVEVNPDLGTAWLYLGIARRKNGDEHGAVPALRKAIRIMPDSPRPRYHLARCLYALGKKDEALKLAASTSERWPQYTAVQNFLRKMRSGELE